MILFIVGQRMRLESFKWKCKNLSTLSFDLSKSGQSIQILRCNNDATSVNCLVGLLSFLKSYTTYVIHIIHNLY